MRLTGVELRRITMPLVAPFTTSFGTSTAREAILVRAVGDDVEGWGECVALPRPVYSSEYNDSAYQVIRDFLVPLLLAAREVRPDDVARLSRGVVGHRMAKTALEMAVLDACLREDGVSFGTYLGVRRDRVPSGVSVGILGSIDELLGTVAGYLDQGYRRIKLKIRPGWDVEPVRAVRERFGDDVPLQVDANTAYRLSDAAQLAKLDDFGLLLIEQPLGDEDLRQHAELATLVRTPICLDESIVSLERAVDAIALRAAAFINIKPGRVGGYLEARRIHDLCLAEGVGVWCGGMLETGIGRAANAALAALPGFTLPGDISASARFYARDITTPIELVDGCIEVPTGVGFGVEPIPEVLEAVTTSVEWIGA